jgi:hypothetical protein
MLEEMRGRKGNHLELQHGCSKKNTEIFFKYLDKLGRDKYFIDPTYPFCSTSGLINGIWFAAFQNAEKYKLYGYRSHENLRQKYLSNSKKNKNKYNNDPWFPNNTLDLVSHPRGKTRASKAPRRSTGSRAPRVRPNLTENLLGLKNRRHEHKNLLTFGPTEEGLKSRENELKNLFGGKRKTRRLRR